MKLAKTNASDGDQAYLPESLVSEDCGCVASIVVFYIQVGPIQSPDAQAMVAPIEVDRTSNCGLSDYSPWNSMIVPGQREARLVVPISCNMRCYRTDGQK